MTIFCVNCGNKLHTNARFCGKCGANAAEPVTPTQNNPAAQYSSPASQPQTAPLPPQQSYIPPQSYMPPQPQAQAYYQAPMTVNHETMARQSKRKKAGNALCIFLAIVLLLQTIVVAMYGWPGFAVGSLSGRNDISASENGQSSVETDSWEAAEPTGLSNIEITKNDYNVEPVTVNVGPENTVAKTGGITVDFGEFNLAAEGVLEIKDLGVKKDDKNGFSARCYDFSLGDVSEFPTYVTITLPYEQTENAADRLFVQYYNDSTGTWELMYSKLDESNGTITFYTDHFSTYALFDYFEYEKGYNSGPLSKVVFSSEKLDEMIDQCVADQELFLDTLRKNSAVDSGLIKIGIDSLGLANNLTSTSDYTVQLLSSTGFISEELSNALGKSFGMIGAGLTAVKVGLSWYKSGDVAEALKKNKYDLIELGLGTAGGTLGAAPLTVAAAGVWLVGMMDDEIRNIQNDGYENEIEHAYQEFTWKYVSYSKIAKEFGCYLPNSMPARAFIDEMKDAVIVNEGNTWAMLLEQEVIRNRTNPEKMFKSIEKLLDDYANVFWELKPNVRKMIAEDIHRAHAWQEPSAQEKAKYKEELKAVLRYRLRKLFACIYERLILDAKQKLLWEIKAFEKQMNTVTEFSVYAVDEEGKDVPLYKTEYKDYIAAFAKSASDRPTIWSWKPGSEDNSKFSCTLYNYINIGSPSCIKFYKTWEDQVEDKAAFTLPFTFSAPVVKLKIGNEGLSADELVGTYDVNISFEGESQNHTLNTRKYGSGLIITDNTDSLELTYDPSTGVATGNNVFQPDEDNTVTYSYRFTYKRENGTVSMSGTSTAYLNGEYQATAYYEGYKTN